MAEIGAVAAIASIALSSRQGSVQRKQQQKAFKRQKQAQNQALINASSERMAQATERNRLRKKKPDASEVLARRRHEATTGIGSTFLTKSIGSSPVSGLGRSYQLGR